MTLEAGDAYGQASFGGEVSDGGSIDVNAGAAIEGKGGDIRLWGGPSFQGKLPSTWPSRSSGERS